MVNGQARDYHIPYETVPGFLYPKIYRYEKEAFTIA